MRETDTVFLQTVGRFIQAQVQLAVIPLAQTIADQAAEISRLKEKQEKEFGQLSTAGNIVSHRLDKLYNATDDWERVARMIDQAIHDLPAPTNGKDGNDGKEGPPGPQGTAGIPGRDGTNGAEMLNAVIDRNGHLIVTLSNGNTKDIGMVVGRDGKNGEPAQPGKDGRDGFGFEDFNIEYDGEKTFTFYFVRGEDKKTFSFVTPLIIYRGLWKTGKFLKGDAVTVDGSMFIAKQDTEAMPGTNKEWQLAAKRGRDGNDGKKGDPGPAGKSGRDGRDLTQLGPDGKKW